MATNITVKNLPTGYQTIISNGRHGLVGDEPVTSKGTDMGFSPTDLILSSIAMCKVATVRYIARRNNWDVKTVEAQLSQTVKRGESGKLSTTVSIAMVMEGNLSEDQTHELLRQADACYVHRMIEGDWNIEKATLLKELAATEIV